MEYEGHSNLYFDLLFKDTFTENFWKENEYVKREEKGIFSPLEANEYYT